MADDYIKLSRKILDWEWYQNINTKVLFIHMIIKANWKPGRFEGEDIPRGSFVSSLERLAFETSLTMSEVRTAISHLKKTGEIASKSHGKYTVFTLVSYDKYQTVDKQLANNSHAIDIRLATIEEKKEGKKERNNKNIVQMHTTSGADAESLFEQLWKLYPCKKGKARVSATAKKNLLKVGYDELARAIGRYKDELDRDSDWRKPQNGSTFFCGGYVDYLDANYVPDAKPNKMAKKTGNSFQKFEQRDYTAGYLTDIEKVLLSK